MLKNRNLCLLAAIIFAVAIIFTACANKQMDKRNPMPGETGLITVSPLTSKNKETTLAEKKPAGESAAKNASSQVKESTTIKKSKYLEFSYKNKSGLTVNYTEDPQNKYIEVASKQLKIPAERLSAVYYNNSITILMFSSANKNTSTLEASCLSNTTNMHFEMPVLDYSKLNDKQKAALNNLYKVVALKCYEEAMNNKPV